MWSTDPNEAGLLDKVMDAQLCQELDEYLLVSRIEWGWDALLATLLALDERHPALLRGILSRCSTATHEEVDNAGELYSALRGEDLLLEDARAEREERRADRGYVSPADARAFLALARTALETPAQDPLTRAHFRDLKPVAAASPSAARVAALPQPPPLRQCDEGLRSIADRGSSDPAAPRQALLRWGAVGVFRLAWASRGGAD